MCQRKGLSGYAKVLFFLAIPVMLEQLSQIFLGTVDTFFAGQIHDNAIAGINVTNMYMQLFTTTFAALGIAVMVMVSRSLGAGEKEKACAVVKNAMIFGIILGLGIGLGNIFLAKPFMMLAGANQDIMKLGIGYYRIVAGSCVLMCLTILLASGLKASQNSRLPMAASVIANLINAVMDFLFMKMGLGLKGLALATMVSRAVNLLILLIAYKSGKGALQLHFNHWHINRSVMRELLQYGIPTALTQLSARFCMVLHGSLILHLGSGYYVANSIAMQIDDFATIPSAGFEAATATMVGNSVGAKKVDDAKRYAFIGFFATAALMTLIGGVLALFSAPLAALFTETGFIQSLVCQVLIFMVPFQWTSAFSHILTSAVQGTGDTKFPLYVTLAGNIIMRLSLGYMLAYLFDWYLIGIWSGIVMDFTFRGILLLHRFRKGKWQKTVQEQ